MLDCNVRCDGILWLGMAWHGIMVFYIDKLKFIMENIFFICLPLRCRCPSGYGGERCENYGKLGMMRRFLEVWYCFNWWLSYLHFVNGWQHEMLTCFCCLAQYDINLMTLEEQDWTGVEAYNICEKLLIKSLVDLRSSNIWLISAILM